jgi:hypothetical protein
MTGPLLRLKGEVEMLDYYSPTDALGTSYFLAGQAVVGIGLGWQPESAWLADDRSGHVEWLVMDPAASLAGLRRRLLVAVAGPVTEWLWWCELGGLRLARAREGADWFVSSRAFRGERGNLGRDEHLLQARVYAREICRRRKLARQGYWDERSAPTGNWVSFWVTSGLSPPEVAPAEGVAVIARAELLAEKLLTGRWATVQAVARTVFDSPDARVRGAELYQLVPHRRVSQEDAFAGV